MAAPFTQGALPNPSVVLTTGMAALPIKAGQASAFKAKAAERYGNLKKKDAEGQLLDNAIARPTGEDAKPVDAEGIGLTLESAFIQALVAGNDAAMEAAVEAAMPGQLAQGLPPSAQGTAGAALREGNNLGGQVFAYAGADALLLAQADTGITAGAAASAAATSAVAAAGIGPLGILGVVGLGVGVAAAAGGSSKPATVAPTVDTLAPTLSITSNVAALKVGETATITFTFSEAPTGFVDGDITTTGGTLGSISGTGLTRTATFTPTASLASGSASITVASASYTDAAGNSGVAGATPSISIDTLAPTVTNTSGAYTASTDTLVLTGTNYNTLLATSESATTDIKARLDWTKLSWDINGDNATTADVSFALSDISSAKVTDSTHLTIVLTSAKGTSLEATTGYGGATLDTLDITAGFAKDAAGNAATTDAVENGVLFHTGQAVIDLGAYGKLIAPVQVEGNWYYYWDRSGDGSNASTGLLNGGNDYATHDVLDGIFTKDINGVTGGGGNTTDTYRYATLNGVNVALPTHGGALSVGNAVPGYQAGTAVGASPASNGSTAANFTYNDLLAVWDAYNGTGTGTQSSGTPTGWEAQYYWSATPSASGHAYVALNNGYVNDTLDSVNNYVALQVL